MQADRGSRVFYPELESLRGLAALAVSLCHVFNSAQRGAKDFGDFSFNDWSHFVLTSLLSSEGGVAIFFVLSGFVLSLQLGDEVTPMSWTKFAIRRIFRIMPACWASVVLAYLMLRVVHHQHPDIEMIAQGLFLYQSFSVPINPPLWSLSVEMTISALLPMMVAANMRFALVFQIVLVWIFYWASSLEGVPFFVPYFLAFQLGIMIPAMGRIIDRLNTYLAAALFGIALVAVMSATNLNWQGLILPKQQVQIEVIGAFYVVAYVYRRKSLSLTAFLNWEPVRFLGRVSYSMYVLNYPLLGVLWTRWGLHQPFSLPHMMLAATVFIPINIASAYVSYRLFEVPFVRWGKSLSGHLPWSSVLPGDLPAAASADRSAHRHARAVSSDWRSAPRGAALP